MKVRLKGFSKDVMAVEFVRSLDENESKGFELALELIERHFPRVDIYFAKLRNNAMPSFGKKELLPNVDKKKHNGSPFLRVFSDSTGLYIRFQVSRKQTFDKTVAMELGKEKSFCEQKFSLKGIARGDKKFESFLRALSKSQTINERAMGKSLRPDDYEDSASEKQPDKMINQEIEAVEGIMRETLVISRSRNGTLKKAALEAAKGVCSACRSDFSRILDGLGTRALQVHHKRQLALANEPRINSVDDLAVVCANCHQMLHADMKKAMPVEELRKRLQQ